MGKSDLLILSSLGFVGSFLDTNSSAEHFTEKKKKPSTRDI